MLFEVQMLGTSPCTNVGTKIKTEKRLPSLIISLNEKILKASFRRGCKRFLTGLRFRSQKKIGPGLYRVTVLIYILKWTSTNIWLPFQKQRDKLNVVKNSVSPVERHQPNRTQVTFRLRDPHISSMDGSETTRFLIIKGTDCIIIKGNGFHS